MVARRLLLLLAVVAALTAAPALAGDGYGDQKAVVDAKLAHLQSKIAAQHAQESQLSSQIASLTGQIHGLELKVGDVSSKLAVLQSDLSLHQRRLNKLNELFHLQTERFHTLEREYRVSVHRLNLRLVNIYKTGQPTAIDVLLAARNFDDVLSQLDYLGAVAKQDKKVAFAVATAKRQVRVARLQTRKVRQGVAQETRVISARTQQQAILRGRAAVEPEPARERPRREVARTRDHEAAGAGRDQRVAGTRLGERAAVSEDRRVGASGELCFLRQHRRRRLRVRAGAELRLRVAGVRADHEPLRNAMGDAPPGARHRGSERDPRPRGRERHRHLVWLDERLREPRDDRPPQRPRDPVRAQHKRRCELQPAGLPGPGGLLQRLYGLLHRPARPLRSPPPRQSRSTRSDTCRNRSRPAVVYRL